MENREINEEIKKYLKKRKEIAVMQEKLKQLKSDKEILEGTVIQIFKEENIKKRVYYGKEITLQHKQDVKIFDEDALLREFAKRKDLDYLGEFTSRKVNTIKFKSFAKKLYTSNKELFPGTEKTEADGLVVTDFVGDIISI